MMLGFFIFIDVNELDRLKLFHSSLSLIDIKS